MSHQHPQDRGCDSDCSNCSIGEGLSGIKSASGKPYAGWQVVLGSMGMFLFPLALAILGASLWRHSQGGQLAGGVGGLVAGMCLAGLTGVVIRRASKDRK